MINTSSQQSEININPNCSLASCLWWNTKHQPCSNTVFWPKGYYVSRKFGTRGCDTWSA